MLVYFVPRIYLHDIDEMYNGICAFIILELHGIDLYLFIFTAKT